MTTQIFTDLDAFQHYQWRNPGSQINGVSEEFAQKHPQYIENNSTNTGCWNCISCHKCEDCINCTNCTDCVGCENCAYCSDCEDCTNCINHAYGFRMINNSKGEQK